MFIIGLIIVAEIFLSPRKQPASTQNNPAPITAGEFHEQTAHMPTTEAHKPGQETVTTVQDKKTQKSVATATKPIEDKKEKNKPVTPTEEKKPVAVNTLVITPATVVPPLEKIAPQENASASTLQSEKDLNEIVRKTIVNIYCTTKTAGAFNPASGSGVVIDPHGIILTNAHVAQYFLFKDYREKNFVTCFVRTGSPARIRYRAELLYISQGWIAANPNINKQDDAPTGNSDFALLRISERVDSDLALPETFPYLPLELDDSDVRVGDNAVVVSYPAGFLEGLSIQNDLFLSSAAVTIKRLFGFTDNALDLFSIGGSIAAQEGSSGGAVVRQKSGKLTGIITLSTLGATTQVRDLRALTLSHINRSFKKETGIDIADLLAKNDFPALAEQFNKDIAPMLTKTLVDALKK